MRRRATEGAPDTLVICPPGLCQELEPWCQLRQDQGHRLRLVTEFQTAEQIKAEVRGAAEEGSLRSVVLVGDVGPAEAGLSTPARHIPTYFSRAVVSRQWGSEPEIATDNWFADLDDDGLPELTIGRLPADSPDELAVLVRKILSYEQEMSAGLWSRRVNLVAGVGGFGAVTDAVLETATRSLITRGIPAEYRVNVTYASWRSPYFPDPRSFRQKTLDRLNEGCLLWVYIGHGRRQGLDWVRVPIGVAPILEVDDVERVHSASGFPVAVFLSCYSAAFDGPEDCLGERLLLQKGGPVAVLGGSRVTMPYGMAVLATALMQETFEQRRDTLGEILLQAKRQLGATPAPGRDASWVDMLARTLSPAAGQLQEERREHVLLFNLLGDPLLRIRHPLPLEVTAPSSAEAGHQLSIECRAPITGEGLVELVCRRGQFTFRPPWRSSFDGSESGMRSLNTVYERANEDCFVRQRFRTGALAFRTTLRVPENVEGPCLVRVYLGDGPSCALGATPLRVDRPAVATQQAAAKTPSQLR